MCWGEDSAQNVGNRGLEWVGTERADYIIFKSLLSQRVYEPNSFDSTDDKFYPCAGLNNCQKAVKYHLEIRLIRLSHFYVIHYFRHID